MSLSLHSKQQTRGTPQQEPTDAEISIDVPSRWSGRVFYGISAVLHIAAVGALSGSWLLGTVTNNRSASAATPAPEKLPAARMAIDVGPIKFCEMNIESLVGRPQSTPGH